MLQVTQDPLKEPHKTLIKALAKYGHLSNRQLTGLTYTFRYVKTNLKELEGRGLVTHRLDPRPFMKPDAAQVSNGRIPWLYYLTREGRAWARELGEDLGSTGHPPERQSVFTLPHTLSATDFLIQAELLCFKNMTLSAMLKSLSERQLQQYVARVQIGRKSVAVVPDGWLDLEISRSRYRISLELDRGTEDHSLWTQKVKALLAWMRGPYEEVFETKFLDGIAVVATTGPERVRWLKRWTEEVLKAEHREPDADLFYFIAGEPMTFTPEQLFREPRWLHPFDTQTYPLLDV